MARTRYNRRRRRGRFAFLWKLLGFVVIIAAVVAAVTIFFRMDHIVVTGCERYAPQEVLDATGLETGSNLYFINKFEVKEAIFRRLAYVEEVRINRKLPDTLLIEVRECAASAGVESGEGVWLISDRGKLLEETETPPELCPLIVGVPLVSPAVSEQADFGEEAAFRADVVLTLLREAETRQMRDKIEWIDMSDETALTLAYLYRFRVRLPWGSDVGYKLESLATVVDYLENNETGSIDLMTEGKASFIPE